LRERLSCLSGRQGDAFLFRSTYVLDEGPALPLYNPSIHSRTQYGRFPTYFSPGGECAFFFSFSFVSFPVIFFFSSFRRQRRRRRFQAGRPIDFFFCSPGRLDEKTRRRGDFFLFVHFQLNYLSLPSPLLFILEVTRRLFFSQERLGTTLLFSFGAKVAVSYPSFQILGASDSPLLL